MARDALPEIWQWAEYYCPYTYVAAVRLETLRREYQGRVRLRIRAFPLELVNNGESAPRDVLDQEWWLAAQQEPAATFVPFTGDDWPTTTLPAFEAAWCALRQDEERFFDFDLRIRRAFFAEGRNIGRREVLLEIAEASGLDPAPMVRSMDSGKAQAAVLAEWREGRDPYKVRGTPTLMLQDGTKLRHPIAYPIMKDRRVVGVHPLPCAGEACLELTRVFFEQALRQGS